MGMLKEGVRLDRVRGGRQKYRRVAPYTTPLPSSNGSIASVAPAAVSSSSNSTSSPEAAHNGSAAKKWSIEGEGRV